MSKLDEIKQNAEGKIEEAKGEVNILSGHKVKSGMQKIKGNLKQTTAPLKDNEDHMDDKN